MSVKRRAFGIAAGIIGVAVMAGVSQAKTITVQNLSQSPSTGVYTYAITFDSEAYVQPGDGFVIYGFPGLTSWSLSGSGSSGSLNSSGTSTTSTGPIRLTDAVGANDLTDGNASTIATSDATLVAADNGVTLDPALPTLTFDWSGPPTIYTGSATATLTLDTSVTTNGDTASVYASVDRSGTDPGVSYGTAEGTVFVPGAGVFVPEPTGGMMSVMLLSGLCFLGRYGRRKSLFGDGAM
ncbi:MAG TPA: hypothetical protein VL992_16740 [Tepidisphaeraceae bacterium]|nr:hypothetical protein [Tepidisphaeraceae bacterium]